MNSRISHLQLLSIVYISSKYPTKIDEDQHERKTLGLVIFRPVRLCKG